MTIILIVLIIITALAVFNSYATHKALKTSNKHWEEWKEWFISDSENKKNHTIKEKLADSYSQMGEVLHTFDCYTENQYFQHTHLINEIGNLVRSFYSDNESLYPISTASLDRFIEATGHYGYGVDERVALKSFLVKVANGTYPPESLLMFCYILMCGRTISDTVEGVGKQYQHKKK